MNALATPPSFLSQQLTGALGTDLKNRILPPWIQTRRWFRSKSQLISTVQFAAVFPCDAGGVPGEDAVFTVVRVGFSTGTEEFYVLPMGLALPDAESGFPQPAVIGMVHTPAGERLLVDGCWHAGFRAQLYDLLARDTETFAEGGTLRGCPTSTASLSKTAPALSRVLSAEQSNTAIVYGQGAGSLFVKLYRRLEAGVHPEPEMLRFLSEQTTFRHAPRFISALEWIDARGQSHTAGLAQEFLAEATDVWTYVLDELRSLPRAADSGLSPALRTTAALIGRRVGEFHRAAASHADDSAFAPEPFTAADATTARARALASLTEGVRDVQSLLATPSPQVEEDARALIAAQPRLLQLLDDAVTAVGHSSTGLKIRTHGDLHLGQILIHTGGATPDIRILDFEGEPGRPLAAAREKQSPLRDVAGMLRSFHYAAHASILLTKTDQGSALARLDPETLAAGLCESFLDEYFTVLATSDKNDGAGVLPESMQTCRALLDLFVLEKATYELQYECNNRPGWAIIPLRGLLALCESKS